MQLALAGGGQSSPDHDAVRVATPHAQGKAAHRDLQRVAEGSASGQLHRGAGREAQLEQALDEGADAVDGGDCSGSTERQGGNALWGDLSKRLMRIVQVECRVCRVGGVCRVGSVGSVGGVGSVGSACRMGSMGLPPRVGCAVVRSMCLACSGAAAIRGVVHL